MNRKILASICATSLLSLGMQVASAESVAVEGSTVFILDNSVSGSQIVVKNLADGTANTCLSASSLDQLGLETGITATDILIKNSTAVVTTHNDTNNVTDVKLVNVASCVTSTGTGTTGGTGTTAGTGTTTETVDLSQCYATLVGSRLNIPCFDNNGEIIIVELEQRGSSMNFEYLSYKSKED